MGGILASIGTVCWLIFDLVLIWLLVIATVLVLGALIAPISLLPLNRLWSCFAHYLGRTNNYIVLGVFYVTIMLPIAFWLRLVKRDVLGRSLDMQSETYFKPVDTQTNKESLRNLF